MKKMLLVVLSVFTLNVVTANGLDELKKGVSDVKETINEAKNSVDTALTQIDTSSVTNRLYTDIRGGITALASGLKVGAEHVYIILVKQQIVNSIIFGVLLIIGVILIISWVKKYKTNEIWYVKERYDSNPTGLGVVRVLQLCFGLTFVIIGICYIDTIITGVINPEYGAIQEIIDMIK